MAPDDILWMRRKLQLLMLGTQFSGYTTLPFEAIFWWKLRNVSDLWIFKLYHHQEIPPSKHWLVFKTSWRRIQDTLQDVLKTSWRPTKCLLASNIYQFLTNLNLHLTNLCLTNLYFTNLKWIQDKSKIHQLEPNSFYIYRIFNPSVPGVH